MDLKIEIADTLTEIVKFADIALRSRLYVSGWTLSSFLKKIRNDPLKCREIALAFCDGKPVGVIISYIESYPIHLIGSIFVKKAFRRQGVGLALVKSLQKDELIPPTFYGHDKRSRDFFNKAKVDWKHAYD